MAITSAAMGGLAVGSIYQAEIDERRAQLERAVKVMGDLLRVGPLASGVDAGAAPPIPPEDEPRAELLRLLGTDGAIALGRRVGQGMAYLDPGALGVVSGAGPIDGPDAEPMRRALAGEHGSIVFTSSDGRSTLAAYAAAPERDLGIVATADLSGLRAIFRQYGALVAGGGLALLLGATVIFFAIGRPMLRRIREGEHRYRELFENMRSGAAVLQPAGDDDDFVLSDLNRGGERIEGVARQDVVGRRLTDILPAIRRTRLFEALRRVRSSGQPEYLPATFYHDERIGGWRETYIYRLLSGDVVTLYEDVTDRKRAEEALKESEARWRSIIEMHAQAIVIVDQKHDIRFVNKSAETLFGHPAQQLIGVPFGYPLVQGEVAEIEILRPGRSIAFAEMRATPMRWSGQDSFLIFIQDVTAHRRVEGDLRKLFQAIEQSPASVMITDVEGRIEYVNPKFTDTTGYTYPEVVGKSPAFLRSGHTSGREYDELWQTIGSGEVWRGEFQNRRKNGELFWELASIAPVRDGRGKVTHYVAVKEDISDRKATEERLRRSQRMEMIGQLTGGIAHDFNNLLAIVLGNLQLLEEKQVIDAEAQELITDAIWSAERGAQLTHRLLAFARRQRLNPKVTDLNQVVEEMAGLLRRTLGERIEVREDLAPGMWETMIDRGQLESALLNLVVNARDAMPGGGVLTIGTGTVHLPRDDPGSEELSPGDYVILTVADTGVGMPPNILEHIFEPFFTTKKFGEGSGLGLSMVYGFVRQSGGHITAESTVGRGTAIKLYLPRAVPVREPEDARQQRRRERAAAGGKVVLVVEDDPRVRKTAANILRKHGYEVVEAGDASEALAVVDRLQRLDLLFTDVVLAKGINGSELAHQVLCRRPEARILLTSGYAQQIPVVDGLFGDGIDLIPKPYRRRELTAKVRDLLDRTTE